MNKIRISVSQMHEAALLLLPPKRNGRCNPGDTLAARNAVIS